MIGQFHPASHACTATLLCFILAGAARAQQAPVHTGAGAKTQPNALDTAHMPDPDRAVEGSPVAATRSGSSLRVGTMVTVVVTQAVSSGSAHNGDAVEARLAAPLRTTSGATLPAGTRVAATVVSAAGAGVIGSAGVLSLQLTRVGAIPIISDVRDFNGQEGHKDVADSAPQKGTEAMVENGVPLEFRVMEQGPATGLMPGVPPATNPAGASSPPSTPGVPPPPHL